MRDDVNRMDRFLRKDGRPQSNVLFGNRLLKRDSRPLSNKRNDPRIARIHTNEEESALRSGSSPIREDSCYSWTPTLLLQSVLVGARSVAKLLPPLRLHRRFR